MTKYIRQGECNRCGQCCGAPGGPDRRSPFPKDWPESLRTWTPENKEKLCPLIPLLDEIEKYQKSPTNPECPFLLDDSGDGTRPCGLVGTGKEYAFDAWCKDEPTSPRKEKFVKEWQWRYPDCSYTWIKEE